MLEVSRFEWTLQQFGHLAKFELYRTEQFFKGHFMDPITAIFNFLATPAGQNVVEDIRKVDQAFINLISGLIKKIHDRAA